jgi:hypothetical protein
MKKIALITSFCNTEEKIKILKNTINILKTLEIDTILFTGLHLPEDIYKNSDYVLISKEYPLLDWPVKSYVQWWNGKVNEYNIIMSVTFPDYGYAVLNQIKRMADLSLSMDYDQFFILDYDLNITDYVKNILLENKPNSFFPSKRGNHSFWPVGLHLISLDREHLTRFKNLITKESYLIDSKGDAFSWTHRAVDFVPGVIESEYMEDLIYNFEDIDFFDYSIIKEIKCFIHKVENQDIKFIFHGFNEIKNFIIKTEDFEYEYNINEWEEIEFPYKEYTSFIVIYEGKEYDFTKITNKIKHNIFTKKLL